MISCFNSINVPLFFPNIIINSLLFLFYIFPFFLFLFCFISVMKKTINKNWWESVGSSRPRSDDASRHLWSAIKPPSSSSFLSPSSSSSSPFSLLIKTFLHRETNTNPEEERSLYSSFFFLLSVKVNAGNGEWRFCFETDSLVLLRAFDSRCWICAMRSYLWP